VFTSSPALTVFLCFLCFFCFFLLLLCVCCFFSLVSSAFWRIKMYINALWSPVCTVRSASCRRYKNCNKCRPCTDINRRDDALRAEAVESTDKSSGHGLALTKSCRKFSVKKRPNILYIFNFLSSQIGFKTSAAINCNFAAGVLVLFIFNV